MRPSPAGAAAPLRRAAAVATGVYLVALLLGPRGHHVWRELVLQVFAIELCAAYVWLLAVRERRLRAWRVPIALWVTFFGLGNVVSNLHTGEIQPQWSIVPSLLLYVICYPNALVATALLLRGRLRAARVGPSVDAAVGALTIGALFVTFVVPPAVSTARAGGVPVALILAFPVCDVVVAALMVASIALSGPERVSAWFALGVALFGSADWWYVISVSTGVWRTGTWADGVWVLGAAVLALLAAPAPDGAGRAVSRAWTAAALVVPFLAGFVALGLLVVGTRRPLPAAGVALAATAVLAVLSRLGLAYATERRHAEERTLARTDELTGLVNRRGLYEALDGALEPGGPAVAVLIADLDGFKQVNDTHGHLMGDALLREVARRIAACVPAGAVVSRLGGDEFAVLVTGPDAREAGSALAVRVAGVVERPVDLGSAQVVVCASVGVAVAPDAAGPVPRGELLHRADLAMYAAKRSPSAVAVHGRDLGAADTGGPAPVPAPR